MFNKAIPEIDGTLVSVPDQYKTQESCDKTVDSYAHALKFVTDCYKTQKGVKKKSILILVQYNLYNLKKCVIKLLILLFLYLILFPIDIRPKK